MTTFCIAYKNEHTTEWAEKTGNMAGGWVRISGWLAIDEAKRLFELRKPDFPNSAVAIFPCDSGYTAWYDRRPWYIHNRAVLVANAQITSALSGLINSKDAGWF